MRTDLYIHPSLARRLSPTTFARLDQLRHQTYVCPFCRVESHNSSRQPTSLVVITDAPDDVPLIDVGPHVTILRFAHPTCSPSRLIRTSTEDLLASVAPEQTLTTSVWIRPHWCQPSTVLLCRTVSEAYRPFETAESSTENTTAANADFTVIRGLVDAGFVRLRGLEGPFPFLADMDARIERSQLTISGPGSPDTLVTCPVSDHSLPEDGDHDGDGYGGPPWYQPALSEGRLGVVLLVGADPDPTIDPRLELESAIAEGRAVAATTRIVAETALSLLAHRRTGRRPSTKPHSITGSPVDEHHFRRAA